MEVPLMSIDWFRDLIICISGLVVTGVLIFVAVLFYSLYRRTKTILDLMQTRAAAMHGITSYIMDELVKPLIELATLIRGMRHGIEAVTKFFKKEEGGKDV